MLQLTAVVTRDGNMYVALCPELDIASQGDTVEQSRANLVEAIELFYETASAEEITERAAGETYITPIEVHVG